MEEPTMTGTQPHRALDRRLSDADRRRHRDRRAHAVLGLDTVEVNHVLRELLGEAHARIRVLEQALERLTSAI
jgi:hypothetical protein